jgi:hypothetical protein
MKRINAFKEFQVPSGNIAVPDAERSIVDHNWTELNHKSLAWEEGVQSKADNIW